MRSPIDRYQQIDGLLATAAQPAAADFAWLREQGFQAVVNLSTPTARNFLADEARLAMTQGLGYVHAPVDCSELEPAHYLLLAGALRAFQGRKVLVHCAGNVKSSALVQLWRILERGEPAGPLLEALRRQGWHEEKWYGYLARMTGGAAEPANQPVAEARRAG